MQLDFDGEATEHQDTDDVASACAHSGRQGCLLNIYINLHLNFYSLGFWVVALL